VALVDDDRMLLGLLAEALTREGLDVVWTAGSAAEALRRVGTGPLVDVIAIDVRMPEVDGLKLAAQLRGVAPQIAVVMMSSLGDTVAVARSIASGAMGYVDKPSDPDELVRVLTAAAAGVGTFPELPDEWENLIPENVAGLTRRELEVLRLLSQHLENHQIAERLVLTGNTVKVHVANILRKLDVGDRRAAARAADEIGLLRRYWPDEA
jgi:DNA-binding NarL/FixJ family response regulator